METNDIDTPTPLPTLDATGTRVEEGAFVLTTGCTDDAEQGEVWGASRGRVLVSWPVKVAGGYRYTQDWHPAADLRVMG